MAEDKKIKRNHKPTIARTPNKVESDGLQREEFLTRLRKHDSSTTFDDSALWASINNIKSKTYTLYLNSMSTPVPEDLREFLTDGEYDIEIRGECFIISGVPAFPAIPTVALSLFGTTNPVGISHGGYLNNLYNNTTNSLSANLAGSIIMALAYNDSTVIPVAYARVGVVNGNIVNLFYNSTTHVTAYSSNNGGQFISGGVTDTFSLGIGNNILLYIAGGGNLSARLSMRITRV